MKTLEDKINEMTRVTYGFVPPTPKPEDHIYGGYTRMPEIVEMPSKDWSPFYPTFESQLRPQYDSCGCTDYAIHNAMETYLRAVHKYEWDGSERYIYNLAEIEPPGADPVKVAQCFRDFGDIKESSLPVTDTFAEFKTPRPMTDGYKAEGKKFGYEFKYEQLWEYGAPISKAQKLAIIRKCYAFSPVIMSVTAWKEQGGVYIDNGVRNNHLVMSGREVTTGLEIFDSYANNAGEATKILSFDHNIEWAMRIMLIPKEKKEEINWILRLLQALKDAVYAIVGNEPVPPLPINDKPMPALPPEPPPVVEERKATIPEIIVRIAIEEGVEPSLALAVAKHEGGLKIPNARLVNNPKSIDRGIFQINSYYHKNVTDAQADDPEWATRWFCQKVKTGQLYHWNASKKNWKKELSQEIISKYNIA